ncbi:hypothetical protein POV27_01980 [Aureisphaera galaxeae]|uniref:tetratricopeptide repeat protein n=1 Tax=Aureisphaera galaxeae TaxID=1538023 RepID=UPI002350C19D|nr:hypothetical protein [Aureisphaera galaxeae]MDC8002810.1 hypothetical protein [Aureisphaera galaxeae]
MPLRKYILLYFLLVSACALGQHSRIDSLRVLAKETKSKKEKAKHYGNISMVYWQTQLHYDSSYYYNEKAFKIGQEIEDTTLYAKAYFNYGGIYMMLEQYDMALENLAKALVYDKSLKDTFNIAADYTTMGGVYYYKKDFKNARNYYLKCSDLYGQIDNKTGLQVSLSNLSKTELEIGGRLKEAKEYMERARDLSEQTGFYYPNLYIGYGKILFQENDIDGAQKEVERGLQLSKERNEALTTVEALDLLYNIETQKNNLQAAIEILNEKMVYEDSLSLAKNEKSIENLKLNFMIADGEAALLRLSQKRKYDTIIYALIFLAVLLLLGLFFRQMKIREMAKQIHGIQQKLIEHEGSTPGWKPKNSTNSSMGTQGIEDSEKE